MKLKTISSIVFARKFFCMMVTRMIMKFLLLSFLVLSTEAFAKNNNDLIPKVLYGEDNRLDYFESNDNLMKELSMATAVQVMNTSLPKTDSTYTLNGKTMVEVGMCKTERFSNQLTAGDCSGFLVSPTTLVTAGHCVDRVEDCADHSWVFDYANREKVESSFKFSEDQVYHCTKIIERIKDRTTEEDYAVLELDRPVKGRPVLSFRTSGKPADDASFTVIGHPMGLPTKIISSADMRDNNRTHYFRINSDTYGGSSGSPVIDSKTGIVEGILVRGDVDFEPTENDCLSSVVRGINAGRGEDVTRITTIKSLMKLKN